MELPKLYGLDSKGRTKEWSVHTEGADIYVTHGLVDGKKQQKVTTAKAKNVGRSNETTPEQQAELEAKSKWNKQKDKSYCEDPNNIQPLLNPMLAHPYEKYAHKVKFPCAVQPKLDGCFTRGMRVWTEKGLLPIGVIVENKLNLKVWSYNETTGKRELKRIKYHHDNGLAPLSDFTRVTMEGGNPITCTKNHKFYTNNGWKEVRHLLDSDRLYGIRNTKILHGILSGMLLGDSSGVIDKRRDLSWRLIHSVSNKDIGYGEYKKAMLESVCSFRSNTYISGYGSECTRFTSTSLTSSLFDIGIFYNTDNQSPDFGKRVDVSEKDLFKVFTDETLAIIYFDDGSLHYNNGNDLTPRMFISVAGLSEKTRESLVKCIERKYGVIPQVGVYGKDVRLSFNTRDTLYLQYRIAKCMSGALDRKLVMTYEPRSFDFSEGYLPFTLSGVKGGKPLKRYDLAVEDNENYFVEGTLVHNCRAIATYEPEGLVFKSRGAKYYPVPDHLLEPVSEALAVAQVLGYDKLDGELYLHGHDLNRIVSAAKKPEPGKLTLEFHVFDMAKEEIPLEKRLKDMEFICDEVDSRYLQYVETNYIDNEKEIMDYHGKCATTGYEGVMIRNLGSLYRFDHRSQDLLKHKEFEDAEYMIVDVVQDKDGRGVFVCSCPDSTHIDKKTFTCVLKGTHEARQHVWDYKEEYIGKPLTVKFQVLTEFNIPEFPVGIAVRDYE